MGNLRENILNGKDVMLAKANYENAEKARVIANEKYKKARAKKREALEEKCQKELKAEKAYDEAVRKALEKAKERFGDRKFTAVDLRNATNGDISSQEFASWVWHNEANFENRPSLAFYTDLSLKSYHLPEDVKRTHPRRVVKKFAELDENGQPIPGTEFTREREECALYWFE